ncbi:hypothetical protein NFI96_009348, partial [Prochilodus magdalenae]
RSVIEAVYNKLNPYRSEDTGPSPSPEQHPHTIIPTSTKTPNTRHSAVRQVPFSWQPPYPDSSFGFPEGEA